MARISERREQLLFIPARSHVCRIAIGRANPGKLLILAVLMIGAIVTCATCCLAALPYLGTVILLPLFVCLRAFGLLFLRQFGPDYDVWASFMPPEFLPILSGPLPAPPPTTPEPNPPPEPPLPPAM